jgi:hypothetical protein
VPFFSCSIKEDRAVLSSEGDLMAIDSFVLYNEIKRSESIFTTKNIIDQNENVLGKIADYEFDEQSGILDNITYVSVNGDMESLNFSDVIDNSKEAIRINAPEKISPPTPEEPFQSFEEEFLKPIEDMREIKSGGSAPSFSNFEKQAEEALSAFKRDLEERKTRFYKFCDSMESEIRNRAESFKSKALKYESENAYERSPAERSLPERNSPERILPERSQTERNLPERNLSERSVPSYSTSPEQPAPAEIIENKPEEIVSAPKNAAVDRSVKSGESGGSRKDLEKLYELQRKRMNILKKL